MTFRACSVNNYACSAVSVMPTDQVIYAKCFNLVTHTMSGHRLAASFEEWKIDSPAALQKQFNKEEITRIYAILERYYLLVFGTTHVQNSLALIGVTSIQEILNPNNEVCSSLEKLFIVAKSDNQQFVRMMRALEAYVKIAITPKKIIKLFEATAVWDYSELLAGLYRPLEELTVEERCRLAYFISVAFSSIEYYTANTIDVPFQLSDKMKKALLVVHAALMQFKGPDSVEKPPEVPVQFRFAKPNIATLPNVIPHAANSCYIAATLVPLAFVCDEQVKASFEKFDFIGGTDAETSARALFRSFYAKVQAEEVSDITIPEVNELRSALQKAYDWRFFNAEASTQEDAGDFLMCLFGDLLRSWPTGHFYVKHTFQQLESSVQIEPELYDFVLPLSTKYRMLEQDLIDISLDHVGDNSRFCDLATDVRHTNDYDLHAYLNGKDSGSYQTIMAHHQEQFVVESSQKAPNVFTARLRRFSQDPATGVKSKQQIPIAPSRTLQFQIMGDEQSEARVQYDLYAITVHSGPRVDNGHYYCYLLHDGKIYKYDDLTGANVAVREADVWQDILTNGYIFYYKKQQIK